MKVTVNTPLAKVVAEMNTEQAMDLLLQAVRYAADYKPQAPQTVEPAPTTIEINDDQKEPEAVKIPEVPPAPKPKTQTETMFGDRSAQETSAAPEAPAEKDTSRPVVIKAKKFKGFMHLKCEVCGETKSFYVKHFVDDYKCEACGHVTDLVDLKLAHAKCPSCQNYIKYLTNMDTDRFDIPCLQCGAPVDMELNKKRDEYDTLR